MSSIFSETVINDSAKQHNRLGSHGHDIITVKFKLDVLSAEWSIMNTMIMLELM